MRLDSAYVRPLWLNSPPELFFLYPSTWAPCCPAAINVSLVTQAMTNVSWSPGGGARYYMVSLTSSRGHAKCHTLDTHCLMGCITCSTSYSVNLEAISSTGHKSECPYRGFSSSKMQLTSEKSKPFLYLEKDVLWELQNNVLMRWVYNRAGWITPHLKCESLNKKWRQLTCNPSQIIWPGIWWSKCVWTEKDESWNYNS